MHRILEQVTIQFNASTAVTPSTLNIYNANGLTRPLQSFERLVIFNLSCFSASTTGQVQIYTYATSTSTVPAGQLILAFSQAGYEASFPEGYPCFTGILPRVIAAGAGQISISGTGGIEGTTQPSRPNWRESLTSGITIQP